MPDATNEHRSGGESLEKRIEDLFEIVLNVATQVRTLAGTVSDLAQMVGREVRHVRVAEPRPRTRSVARRPAKRTPGTRGAKRAHPGFEGEERPRPGRRGRPSGKRTGERGRPKRGPGTRGKRPTGSAGKRTRGRKPGAKSARPKSGPTGRQRRLKKRRAPK